MSRFEFRLLVSYMPLAARHCGALKAAPRGGTPSHWSIAELTHHLPDRPKLPIWKPAAELTHVPLGPSGFDPRLSPTLEVMDHDGATKLATVTGPCC